MTERLRLGIRSDDDWDSPEYRAYVAAIVDSAPPLPDKVIDLLRRQRDRLREEAS